MLSTKLELLRYKRKTGEQSATMFWKLDLTCGLYVCFLPQQNPSDCITGSISASNTSASCNKKVQKLPQTLFLSQVMHTFEQYL